ncbi:MAG: EAL domain-containing protein [Nocardioidaceae bacterium]|nr:EAL domain-containing protein [Nocardioidaceae bacterium]
MSSFAPSNPRRDHAGEMVVVLGRQPIVDRAGTVVGHELLYRTRIPAELRPTGEQMTARVVFGTLTMGVEHLSGGGRLWCNASRGSLVGDVPIALPPESTTIEVLEAIEIDDALVDGCRDLVRQGYQLALDDFTWTDRAEELLVLADVVKIDVLAMPRADVLALVERCRPFGVRLLAEKVETADDVRWAHEHGFDLFQGYAIDRPELMSGRSIPPSVIGLVQLSAAVLSDDLEPADLEDILRREPGLAAQVLQLASSGAADGLSRPLRTLREAIVLLGTRRLRQWVAVVSVATGLGARSDVVSTVLARARMCELLSQSRSPGTGSFAFTAGLLSGLDVLLGAPADQLGSIFDFGPDLTAAAFDRTGVTGHLVAEVIAYQDRLSHHTLVDDPELDDAAALALTWATPCVTALAA